MKTILLTSAGMQVKAEILKLLSKPANQTRVAHIITASKVEKNTAYVEEELRAMGAVGFQVTNVDIEAKTTNELRNILQDKDIIYVQGGNTFYLLKHAKTSGFDIIVKELIDKGIIYIGVSAGSYIACPTIEMAIWKHQDRNRIGLTDLTALHLVPFLLSVHYTPKYKEILKKAIKQTQYPVRILTDKQALLVRGEEVMLVGSGTAVLL
ncbi:MAG: Type 1 glutamine amidotransferase-like domain-containing protein [bacterium]|nr:Type 1 glutamine amidotransferase-like domain-containing protein [bacterium]